MPVNLEARYCFEPELITIPGTKASLEVPSNTWIAYDNEKDNLYTFTFDQFADLYLASDKKSQKYYEFVNDSYKNDYLPYNENIFDFLVDEVKEELLEKEISLTLQGRLRLIWDLILGKKINISKY